MSISLCRSPTFVISQGELVEYHFPVASSLWRRAYPSFLRISHNVSQGTALRCDSPHRSPAWIYVHIWGLCHVHFPPNWVSSCSYTCTCFLQFSWSSPCLGIYGTVLAPECDEQKHAAKMDNSVLYAFGWGISALVEELVYIDGLFDGTP